MNYTQYFTHTHMYIQPHASVRFERKYTNRRTMGDYEWIYLPQIFTEH